MKKNYRKPVVETLMMSVAASLMQAASSGVPSFNGTPIEDNGIQGDAR